MRLPYFWNVELKVEMEHAIKSVKGADLKQYLYLFFVYKARMQTMRMLEKQSRYKELNGAGAAEYLQKAKTLFKEMQLQSDLDELGRIDRQAGISH